MGDGFEGCNDDEEDDATFDLLGGAKFVGVRGRLLLAAVAVLVFTLSELLAATCLEAITEEATLLASRLGKAKSSIRPVVVESSAAP